MVDGQLQEAPKSKGLKKKSVKIVPTGKAKAAKVVAKSAKKSSNRARLGGLGPIATARKDKIDRAVLGR